MLLVVHQSHHAFLDAIISKEGFVYLEFYIYQCVADTVNVVLTHYYILPELHVETRSIMQRKPVQQNQALFVSLHHHGQQT